MEDGLVLRHTAMSARQIAVLILVVMEDGLVHHELVSKNGYDCVLILVVMEDGLVRTVNHSAMSAAQMS